MKTLLTKIILGCSLTLAVQTALANSTGYTERTYDPYEEFNRGVYQFNKKFDYYLLKTVATIYKTILPNFVIKGIGNFFSNLGQLPTIGNDLLQGEFYQATGDTWRLLINSSAGILGLFDVASQIGLPKHSQDFGLTLAKWGYRSSNYLVLPFFGPSTIRDTLGLAIDYNALSVYPHVNPKNDRYALIGANFVNQRANLLNLDDVVQQAALDEYTFIRDIYLQRRANNIQQTTHTVNTDHEDDYY
jgi:phospholipid-binding lipoprotein MlaA